MVLKEAYRILEVKETDDEKTIKLQFRKKISMYHPDVVGSDHPEHLKKAQQINEAYALLRKHKERIKKGQHHSNHANGNSFYESQYNQYDSYSYEEQGGAHWYWDTEQTYYEEETPAWEGKLNESAFVERDIYRAPYTDIWQQDECKKVARGKYYWNPDQEDFPMLLRSLNKATIELMEQIERQNRVYFDYDDIADQRRFEFQTKIFNCLAGQFIEPVACLKKVTEPARTDKQGRSIYAFRALLGAKGSSKAFHALEYLEVGDLLYPSAVSNNRIMVHDAQDTELGYLSLDDDQLYYLIIPILQYHKAQVRIAVTETQINKHTRPFQAKINVNLYLRMEQNLDEVNRTDQNLKIAEVLNQYETYLKERR